MSISERIEFLRKQNGISLTYLNRKIGAYRGKLTEVRHGKSTLSESEINILAETLSTTPDYLLGKTDNPAIDSKEKEPTVQTDSELDETTRELFNLVDTLSDEDKKIMLDMAQAIIARRKKD